MKNRFLVRTCLIVAAVGGLAGIASCGERTFLGSANGGGDTNKVEYWCPNGGIKYEPVSTPFVVPAPPAGKVWTLLVLKAGSENGGSVENENETFDDPIVGESYERTDGKGISHAILCYEMPPGTTTTTQPGATTTTLAGTTTTQQNTTTTGGTLTPFVFSLGSVCVDGGAFISITFGDRPDLDGQTGTLTFSTGGSVPLTFDSNATVQIPYPASAGTGTVNLLYTLGDESEDGQVTFPPNCTTTTTAPGVTTTTAPGATTTTAPAATTTTVPGATTTTVPATFTFGAAASVCVREVPTIRIVFQNQFPSLAGQTGTLTMTSVNGGGVVSVQPLVYTPGATVDILYPGTRVNADGTIADVPGWNLNSAGFWVRDPNDEFLRDGIILTYTVNPTATATVTYPPESSTCANPDGPFPPGTTATTTPGLPPTR